jgi:DNA-binding NarL/FixJ family response regulator
MTNRSILIVEDEILLALALQLHLEKWGYQVCGVAVSAESTLDEVEQTRPDLILMDIGLYGDDDGIVTAEQIHRRFPIPIIFITGYTDTNIRKRAMQLHPAGFLVKPIDYAALHELIQTCLPETA